MKIKPLRNDLIEFLQSHKLTKKWQKAVYLFESSIRHPSLHSEILEPKWRGIYSFRIDKQYRALFFIREGEAEMFQITKHYRK